LIGIGNDLVDIDRFRRVLERTPSLRDRLFTDAERAYADARSDPTERSAVRFAAKEAVMKALGVGLGDMTLRDIEVVRAESGAPQIVLHGSAATLAAARGVSRWLVTLSHSATVAQAIVVAL
jgi:holo-[acyl-carrier protein] synthase